MYYTYHNLTIANLSRKIAVLVLYLIIISILCYLFYSEVAISEVSAKTNYIITVNNQNNDINQDSYNEKENIFIINNVSASAYFGNKVDAITIVNNESAFIAFIELIKRIIPYSAIPKLRTENINHDEVNDMIEKREVIWDRTTSRSYRATFNIYFNPQKVKNFLNKKGIRYTNEYSAKNLFIPILHRNDKYIIWEDDDWSDIWKRLQEKSKALVLQNLDRSISTVSKIDPSTVMVENFSSFRTLLDENTAENVILVFAEDLRSDLEVTVKYLTKKEELLRFIKYKKDSQEEKQQFLERAAIDVLDRLDALWKGIDTFSTTQIYTSKFYSFIDPNKNSNQLLDLLKKVPYIKKCREISRKDKKLEIEIEYSVPPVILSHALKKHSIIVYRQADDVFIRLLNKKKG